MIARKMILLAGLGLAFAATSAHAQSGLRAVGGGAEVIPGQYICDFSGGYIPRSRVGAEAERAAASAGGRILHVYSHSIRGFAISASEQAVRRMLATNADVTFCEPDQVMRLEPGGNPGAGKRPGGPPSKGGGDSGSTGETTPWGIARVNGGTGGSFGVAWVIDTGIDGSHPDLNVDSNLSRSFGKNSNWADKNGHGTHVAGTIAAIDNEIGVVGVAPGATVVAVRVLEANGSGSYSSVIAGVEYVAQNGRPGDVANMSLGGPGSTALDNAVIAASANVAFAVAAGNSGADADNYSPARANGSNLYTVSAFKNGDAWASFSNYGNPPIDYAEPGVSVLSTWKGGDYKTISGTSMATPHLAGILLAGSVGADGNVSGDPDGNPDPIGVR
jgi:hypothetical protein